MNQSMNVNQANPVKQGNTKLARGLLWACAIADALSLFVALFLMCSAMASSPGSLAEANAEANLDFFLVFMVAVGNVVIGAYALSQGLLSELKARKGR